MAVALRDELRRPKFSRRQRCGPRCLASGRWRRHPGNPLGETRCPASQDQGGAGPPFQRGLPSFAGHHRGGRGAPGSGLLWRGGSDRGGADEGGEPMPGVECLPLGLQRLVRRRGLCRWDSGSGGQACGFPKSGELSARGGTGWARPGPGLAGASLRVRGGAFDFGHEFRGRARGIRVSRRSARGCGPGRRRGPDLRIPLRVRARGGTFL